MKRKSIAVVAILALLVISGCSHQLVPNPGEHTIRVYPDEATFQKVKDFKKQAGPLGALGDIGAGLVSKDLPEGTPVKIVSSDADGSMIEVTDGPNKGVQGFVPTQNIK